MASDGKGEYREDAALFLQCQKPQEKRRRQNQGKIAEREGIFD